MTVPQPARCPDCGGNLYLEPDLVEALVDLVCLQCSRRFRHGQDPGYGPAARLRPAGRVGISTTARRAGEPQ